MKNVTEWSLEFDLLYNNISSNKAPGLEEYEKSVFLTRAQENIVVALYKGLLGEPFESTEETTDYLGVLIKQADCDVATNEDTVQYKLVADSVLYKLPKDLLFRTWEGCTITDSKCGSKEVRVIPITQDEYWRVQGNPFRGATSRKVLRLSYAVDESSPITTIDNQGFSELISKYPITKYTVRYISRPMPIILTQLSGGLTINGETSAMTCKLDEALHQTILAEAVRLAKAVWNL